MGKLLVGCVPGVDSQQVNATAARLSRGSWEAPAEGLVHRVQVEFRPTPIVPPLQAPLKDREAREVSVLGCAQPVETLQEELQDEPPNPLRVCRACKEIARQCEQCNFRAQGLSESERRSVEYMEARMRHDPEAGLIHVQYPFVDRAHKQPNNGHQVVRVQENIERKVIKDGLQADYNSEMSRMLEAGAVRGLSDKEMHDYDGGVHYMPHFPVINPESSSTRLRIVVDSKFRNGKSLLSFNDLIRDVPNALNDITEVQWRWRQFPVSLCYDLSKAYHKNR